MGVSLFAVSGLSLALLNRMAKFITKYWESSAGIDPRWHIDGWISLCLEYDGIVQ